MPKMNLDDNYSLQSEAEVENYSGFMSAMEKLVHERIVSWDDADLTK